MNHLPEKQLIVQNTSVYETIYNPDLTLSHLSTNEFVEISVVVDGSGIHRILNEADECHIGDMYILGSGVPHGYFSKSETEKPTVCTLAFNPSELFDGEWSNPESIHFCAGVFRDKIPVSYAMFNAKIMSLFRKTYDLIEYEQECRNLEWDASVKSHLALLLVAVSRYIDMADTVRTEHPKEWITVSAAMREILDRCSDGDMTLESIASTLLVSKSHLSRIFQKVTGETFADYVRNIRISLACKLLKTTSLTNEEIVGRCGLKDVPSFYKIFKMYIGMTPYQYRMSQKTYEGETVMSIYLEISENLQRGKSKIVKELVQKAVDEGLPAAQILNEGLLAGMNIIGEKFKTNEVYVPEVLVAARAMNMGMQVLKPLLIEDGVKSTGKVCIGTVQGDLHDIGKNLVKIMMEGKGLEVIDLGTDVAPETFVNTAIEQNCQIICCSALLTTTMEVMADVVKQAEAAGIRDKVKIMVGGAPVTEEFCKQIGADKYTSDAASAADAAVELCS
ncbi:MAG: cobalamin-dependent protein [Clostridia bacterium]|nr:cobalamin-dependent protein [Clostridia bacterium]